MGRQKLLLPFEGKPLLQWTVEAILECEFEKTFVVVSQETKKLLPAVLFSMKRVERVERVEKMVYVVNPDPDRGKDSSFYCGLEALEGQPAFAIFLGDKPMITTEQIQDLQRRFKATTQSALIPRKDGAPGHPAFYAPLWRQRFLRSNMGARETLFRHSHEVQWTEGYESCFFDVDTEEDYRQLLRSGEEEKIPEWRNR
jgi:molybdenum cofactor cytidylyltransferase